MSREGRQSALRLGFRAEKIAVFWLRLKGYRILAQRYKVAGGEVDVIARRGDVVAFVEVKARATLDEALLAIDSVKRRRINRAAAHWLAGKDWAMACTLRGDALCVAPWRLPRHVRGEVALRAG